MIRPDRPLPEQITAAARELKLARRDGGADWIADAVKRLDELIESYPRTPEAAR